jgi:purine-nucleoside phosphorylase
MAKSEKSIVKPSAFKGFTAEHVLLIPVDTPGRLIERTLEEVSKKGRRLPMGRRFSLKQRTVVLYGCIGAPAVVLSLESLASGGARDILLLGLCGSLCRRARLLDTLLVTHALADEGTSAHYFPDRKEFYPSDDFMQEVENTVCRKGLPYLPGAVVSTDAPYRETPSWRERFLESGMDGVDMETSAVFALAEFHGLRAASLLIVSDELTELGHNSGFGHPKLEETMLEYFIPFVREKSE